VRSDVWSWTWWARGGSGGETLSFLHEDLPTPATNPQDPCGFALTHGAIVPRHTGQRDPEVLLLAKCFFGGLWCQGQTTISFWKMCCSLASVPQASITNHLANKNKNTKTLRDPFGQEPPTLPKAGKPPPTPEDPHARAELRWGRAYTPCLTASAHIFRGIPKCFFGQVVFGPDEGCGFEGTLTATGKTPKSFLRPAFGRPEGPFRCFPGSSPAKIRPGRPIYGPEAL
jgi:hypothetical protein